MTDRAAWRERAEAAEQRLEAILEVCRHAHEFRSDDDPMVRVLDLAPFLDTTEFDYLREAE